MNVKLYFISLTVATIFLGCGQQQNAKDRIEEAALAQGILIADSTQTVLAANLKMAIKEGGLKNAINYCNLQAMPLTREMEEKFRAKIKRTTFKTRNPADNPNKIEQDILSQYDSINSAGGKLQPHIRWVDQQTLLYSKPIKIGNSLCLNCHGKVGEVVSDSFYAFIKEKYPEDKATGYEMGDLRGMWSISFDKAALKEMDNH